MNFVIRYLQGIPRALEREGWPALYRRIAQTGDFRFDVDYVGKDELGNMYYKDDNAVVGRDRFVVFAKDAWDPSQVTPRWHLWLHHISDEVPSSTAPRAKFEREHIENLTHEDAHYVPAGHLQNQEFQKAPEERVEAWKPDQ